MISSDLIKKQQINNTIVSNTRGLKKIQAICAVMRKLWHAIHAMFKTRTTFESHRF